MALLYQIGLLISYHRLCPILHFHP